MFGVFLEQAYSNKLFHLNFIILDMVTILLVKISSQIKDMTALEKLSSTLKNKAISLLIN